jgi:receptor protein-tyrosine kinase
MSIIEQAARRLEELRRAGIGTAPGGEVKPEQRVRTNGSAADPVVAELAPAPKRSAVVAEPVPPAVAERRAAPEQAPTARPPEESKQIDIDLTRLAEMGYLATSRARSQLADEFRVIKRPLLVNALAKSGSRVDLGNLLMVTSSVPGEGKTFTAINLALSMAMEFDSTVLLVDADVARPSVLERLALPDAKGLLDVLTDPTIDVADVILRTNIERLSILPAGTHHPRATELLASDSMNRLLRELAGRYEDRILVFDAPPLLPSTESRVLATHMGQVVVVVEADRTQRSMLTQALATIEACPVVMTLLNKVAASEVGSYYGYYGNARG